MVFALMKPKLFLLICAAIAAFALPFPASATLGGTMASVRDDQAKMQGTLQTTNGSAYNVHEIRGTSGVVLREYVTSAGNVFGVAWQGRTHPDLHQVLGAYYDQYVQTIETRRAQHRGHGPVAIQQPGLVVQVGGHMGSLIGRAYIPQSMPVGVRAEEIR
jgi:hypothetical protein